VKPEKDGLFCESILRPTKDWGATAAIHARPPTGHRVRALRRRGDRPEAFSREQQVGQIDWRHRLAHLGSFKGVPSRLGYLLDTARRQLEKVYTSRHA